MNLIEVISVVTLKRTDTTLDLSQMAKRFLLVFFSQKRGKSSNDKRKQIWIILEGEDVEENFLLSRGVPHPPYIVFLFPPVFPLFSRRRRLRRTKEKEKKKKKKTREAKNDHCIRTEY